ncbi:hypothetical protein SPRG_12694 [Saprolegnia parasitica CBS 223.65]|uniref:SANT and BTB domain-containing protein n=1 Tax=Saprolegnia parasitica (strain CBS 223.65) TaxID=695850 RepID=A0A067BVD1_SAPPC|nr:hypothetical protein SPRG_12694 [Saprolegnia parasitica CBS 223.65]KDO22198.1 hypothetical protein SPRG_12694 [Saprolegnia parasitica CBS 223.65]|eukprot:XP_012207134.1 hypothetical protein SPRG_12694 [Saprolegnia parasitica CBS 223.65]
MQRKGSMRPPPRTIRGSVDEKAPTLEASDKKPRKMRDETIVIHVCDEFRKVNRDFTCNKALLLENMRYFSAYLSDAGSNEDIDISVHCDVGIFEWLYNYVHAANGVGTSPLTKLGVENVTPILISSDFLQMDYLVNECTSFIGTHLESVVDMPGDLLCVSEGILDAIALKCSLEQLDMIEPRKEKLCYKLYTKRIGHLLGHLKQLETSLDQCAACSVIYYSGHISVLHCRDAIPTIGAFGQVLSRHEPRGDWKVDPWLKALAASPKTTYWKLWGALQCFYCVECHTFFTGSEFKECVHHPPPPPASTSISSGLEASTHHACCGAPRFAADARATRGCTYRDHVLGRPYQVREFYAPESNLSRLHELAVTHGDLIARDKPSVPPVATALSAGTSPGVAVHDMLRPSVVARKTMLANVEVPSDLIKSLKSNSADLSTPQTRKQWKIDLLQEKDRIRVQLLSSTLTKMRTEYRAAFR